MNVMLSSISRHARWNLFWLVTICVSLAFTACSNDDDPVFDSTDGKEYTGIPLIILDTDIGSSTDDLVTNANIATKEITASSQNEHLTIPKFRGFVTHRLVKFEFYAYLCIVQQVLHQK